MFGEHLINLLLDQKCISYYIFLHIMDVFLSEPHFLVFGHICADEGYAIPFKAISRDK